jgi:hypothetical protein
LEVLMLSIPNKDKGEAQGKVPQRLGLPR